MAYNLSKILVSLVVLALIIVINVVLIMLVWNNVLIKKFPSANIQKLGFVDALAISVLAGLLFGTNNTVSYCCN